MTIAEIAVFILLVYGLTYLLRPLKRRLDAYFYKLFRKNVRGDGNVIDITDSVKKKDK